MNICSVNTCLKPYYAKGFCKLHYVRFKKHGDPLAVSWGNGSDGKYRTNHPLYKCYHSMKERCLNPNHKSYINYGCRGITICERWLEINGFWNFVTDMGEKLDENYSLDRINNDDGYSPINCKWSTKKEQVDNRRPKHNSTGYRGVERTSNGKFRARIWVEGKIKDLGRFSTAFEASECFENFISGDTFG